MPYPRIEAYELEANHFTAASPWQHCCRNRPSLSQSSLQHIIINLNEDSRVGSFYVNYSTTKMHPITYKLNQYNWLGQKLLTQHRYAEVVSLKNHLSALRAASIVENGGDQVRLVSDHLNYIDGLALMKTSTKLDELILTLQKLDFQKNSQYFLLLCRCLLYMGNYDGVVALCRQILNKEIDMISSILSNRTSVQENAGTADTTCDQQRAAYGNGQETARNNNTWGQLQRASEESVEFIRILDNVNKNRLINDPRLWHIFSRCLKLQLKFADADLAYRMACKLAIAKQTTIGQIDERRPNKAERFNGSDSILIFAINEEDTTGQLSAPVNDRDMTPAALCNFYLPHLEYAEFCIRQRENDFRTALQTLGQASSNSPINHMLHPPLALMLCCQPNSNFRHFNQAIEIISALDAHAKSTQNPSFVYNQLALKCKQKLSHYNQQSVAAAANDSLATHATIVAANQQHEQNGSYECNPSFYQSDKQTVDEFRAHLDYLLIQSHIIINNLVQNSSHNMRAYKCSLVQSSSSKTETISTDSYKQLDTLIESLKSCDPSYWSSHSLWNNLGISYLMKRRYIACLSCLLKAQQLNPLDWRIQYNLGLAFLHVGVIQRSLNSLIAAKSLYRIKDVNCVSKLPRNLGSADSKSDQLEPSIQMLIAICFSELGALYESRRLYAEMVVQMRNLGTSGRALVAPIVNYLLFLSKNQKDELDQKLVIRLLEFLEQGWLQRDQNDAQFNDLLLELARLICENSYKNCNEKSQVRKILAWVKDDYQVRRRDI